MKNLDFKNEMLQKINAAVEKGDNEEFVQVFNDYALNIQESIIQEAQSIVSTVDTNVLASRGVRQLTSDENKYYQKTIEAMKSTNPKQALTDLDVVMPETVINAVFDDLKSQHELLNHIDFMNTTGLTKILLNKAGKPLITWGKLCSKITNELESGFMSLPLLFNKLSAWIPVCNDMLDLGPAWLDKYVRTILSEYIAFGLEEAILNGTGKDMPIGMRKDVSEDASVVGGESPDKKKVKVTSLDAVAYGKLLSGLATTEKGNPRIVQNLILVVNPVDYFNKIMPATTIRSADGTYVSNVLPYPTTIIQSVMMKEGEAILGLGKEYFMGIGADKSGKIEYSDDFKFLDDERVYKVKLHGDGRPKDNNAFQLLDVSTLEPAIHSVKVISDGAEVETK